MVVELNNMSQEDLRATRDHFADTQREIKRERAIKHERLVTRIEAQATGAVSLAVFEAQVVHAQQVYDLLAAASAPQPVLDEQQEVIDAAQREVDGYGANASFVTDPDAQKIQFELDVLDYSITRLGELIVEVDALLT